MNPLSPKTFGIIPSKTLGQNFITSKNDLYKFIKTVDPKRKDRILEIGPGLGSITKELAQKAEKVIAVEKSKALCDILEKELKGFNNIKIINEDILKLDLDIKKYKVVGNLPFYLTNRLMRIMLEKTPKEMIVITQKEVTQRICAKPPRMSILSVSVQIYSNPKIVSHISKNSFWPKPKVDGSIIKITNIKEPNINIDLFFKIVKAGFLSPRKQIINNFSKSFKKEKVKIEHWLKRNNIDPSQRAQTLEIEDWKRLTNNYGAVDI